MFFYSDRNCWESADLLGKWDLKSWIWRKKIIFYGDRHFWESADLLWKSCMPCSAVQTWELTMWDSANNIGNITSSHPDSTHTSSKKISNLEIFLVSWNFPTAKMTGKKCGNKKELNIYGPIFLRNMSSRDAPKSELNLEREKHACWNDILDTLLI